MGEWLSADAAEPRRKAPRGITTSRTNDYWLVRAIGWMRNHERATSIGQETRSLGESRTVTWCEPCRKFHCPRLPQRDQDLFEDLELLQALTGSDGDATQGVARQDDQHARFLLQAGAKPLE